MDIILLGSISSNSLIEQIKHSFNKAAILTDDHHLYVDEQKVFFDYLIITDYSLIIKDQLNLIKCEHQVPITNFYHQTVCENIYYCDSDIAFKKAIQHINEGDF